MPVIANQQGEEMSEYEPVDASSTPAEKTETGPTKKKVWLISGVAAAILIGAVEFGPGLFAPAAPAAAPAPEVQVSVPLQRSIDHRLSFLGQFAAARQVEIRPQVGGTLTGVFFKDGDIVGKGQLLFQIDPIPYRIKVDQARAELQAANARLALASRELARARELKAADAGSTENVDQKVAEAASARAAVAGASAMLRDAQFDLDRTRVYAPFRGRIGTHLVSAGNLVAGSRAASAPTTLLTTLVSIDPIWLNFDMSEGDYMQFLRERGNANGALNDEVEVALSDEASYSHRGTLDFLDNALDRSSGTIHARATLQNVGALLTPGSFGRVRFAVSKPAPAFLVPDAAVVADQGEHSVYVLGPKNVVKLRKVEIGDLRGGLRVIKSGVTARDKIAINGIPSIRDGATINPKAGAIRFAADRD